MVQCIGAQGMLVDLIVFHNNDRVFGTDAQSERFARYIIARYAAYPHLIWYVCNEWNYSPKPRPFWNRIGRIFRSEDPWMEQSDAPRTHSIHQQTRVDFQFFRVDWPVHAIVQYGVRNGQKTIDDEWNESVSHKAQSSHGDAWGNLSIVHNLGHGMPVVNDEYGYIGEQKDKSEPGSPPFTRDKHRQVMWGIVAAGGYAAAGGEFAIELSPGTYQIRRYDPRTGQDIELGVVSGGIEALQVASGQDWIVYCLSQPRIT